MPGKASGSLRPASKGSAPRAPVSHGGDHACAWRFRRSLPAPLSRSPGPVPGCGIKNICRAACKIQTWLNNPRHSLYFSRDGKGAVGATGPNRTDRQVLCDAGPLATVRVGMGWFEPLRGGPAGSRKRVVTCTWIPIGDGGRPTAVSADFARGRTAGGCRSSPRAPSCCLLKRRVGA